MDASKPSPTLILLALQGWKSEVSFYKKMMIVKRIVEHESNSIEIVNRLGYDLFGKGYKKVETLEQFFDYDTLMKYRVAARFRGRALKRDKEFVKLLPVMLEELRKTEFYQNEGKISLNLIKNRYGTVFGILAIGYVVGEFLMKANITHTANFWQWLMSITAYFISNGKAMWLWAKSKFKKNKELSNLVCARLELSMIGNRIVL